MLPPGLRTDMRSIHPNDVQRRYRHPPILIANTSAWMGVRPASKGGLSQERSGILDADINCFCAGDLEVLSGGQAIRNSRTRFCNPTRRQTADKGGNAWTTDESRVFSAIRSGPSGAFSVSSNLRLTVISTTTNAAKTYGQRGKHGQKNRGYAHQYHPQPSHAYSACFPRSN
ncbi:hypothetical protein HDF16_004951 [Granulicella aggregans]|uniref:Uncharacterized protein n=1 Tax=Granulicella aggregans TaxID=474949 RepID=A0A7W8E7F8_9BACT|nr:hypothetical protein [Granulicella aggregans]